MPHLSSFVDQYLQHLQALIERARVEQAEALEAAAARMATTIQSGGCVHLFGTGHSHLLAEEIFYRAGGLIPINAMLDPTVVLSGGALRSTATERRSGAAAEIAARYDLRRGDTGIVISNSGRNPAPVEMALLMKDRGLAVIGVTSIKHSQALPVIDPAGRRLLDVADIVLDNMSEYGDAGLHIPGVLHPAGPTSTVVGAALLQALVIATMENLTSRGERVVNLPSGNVPEGDRAAVATEVGRVRERIKHL